MQDCLNTANILERKNMTKLRLIVVTLSVLFHTCAAHYICDSLCVCKNDLIQGQMRADCSRSQLSVVPNVDSWPKDISVLDLSNNNITQLDIQLSHEQLSVLKLNDNKIKLVHPSSLSGLKNLKHLDLSFNVIEEIGNLSFHGLNGLISLNLGHNKIKSINDFTFASLFSLQELSLAGNEIIHFEKNHWNRMFYLTRLDISNVGAYFFDANLFHGLERLEFIDMSHNEFHEVPTMALRSAKAIKKVRLSGNPIKTLHDDSFLKLATLEELEISFMSELETVESKVFSDLSNLRSLEMKLNKKLAFIHPEAFRGLFKSSTKPMLQEINLEFNKLSTLPRLPCNAMEKMNLQSNPWNCDCRMRWIKTCLISEIYAADLKCYIPENLRNKLVVGVSAQDFKCDVQTSMLTDELHHNRVMRTISLALGCSLLVLLAALIIVVLKWRNIREWWRNNKRGPGAVYYIRARANPVSET